MPYDRQKYAALLRQAFEPFGQFTATPTFTSSFLDLEPRRRFVSLSSSRHYEIAHPGV